MARSDIFQRDYLTPILDARTPTIQPSAWAAIEALIDTRLVKIVNRHLPAWDPRGVLYKDVHQLLPRSGIADPDEAWETLIARDIIPIEWADAQMRAFIKPGMPQNDHDELRTSPWHAFDCVVVAQHKHTIRTVESLYQECVARFRAIGYHIQQIPVWEVGPNWPTRSMRVARPWTDANEMLLHTPSAKNAMGRLRTSIATTDMRSRAGLGMEDDIAAMFAWEIGAANDRAVGSFCDAVKIRRPSDGGFQKIASGRSPFAPLVEIWMLNIIVSVHERGVTLHLPGTVGYT